MLQMQHTYSTSSQALASGSCLFTVATGPLLLLRPAFTGQGSTGSELLVGVGKVFLLFCLYFCRSICCFCLIMDAKVSRITTKASYGV